MTDAEKKRLRYLTRRGLLELDIVLTRFMKTHFDALSEDELEVFRDILDWQDQDFLAIVNGYQEVPEERFEALITLIRSA